MPAGRKAMTPASEHCRPNRKRDPEGERRRHHLDAGRDDQTTGQDDHVDGHHRGRHRAPPEIERIDAIAAEHEEAQHETDVRRIEQRPPAPADQVLGQHRDRGGCGEDVSAAKAPPLPVLRAIDSQEEGHTVAGEQRARRPREHLPREKHDRELDDRAGAERDEYLRDRQLEAERGLPEHLE